MRKIKLLLLLLFINPMLTIAQSNTWMRQAKWGLMSHFVSTRIPKNQMNIDAWNKLVNNFDVKGLALQLHTIRAGYYMITLGQNSGFYCAPNKVYDQLVGISPSKCSHRDLIGDLATELKKYNIKLIVYMTAAGPQNDSIAVSKLEWQKGGVPNKSFQQKWEKIIREYSIRWKNSVAGWWFDECYYPNMMYRSVSAPNFASFSAAARAGNPNSVIAFNPGVFNRTFSITPDEDYIAGEVNDLEQLKYAYVKDGVVDGKQLHVLSYLGTGWSQGQPRYSDEKAATLTKNVIGNKGVVTWDTPIQSNGLIPDAFMKQLTVIGNTIN